MSGQMLVPVIPDSAPFTPAQRAWLNGFLAGLYSQGEVAATQTAGATRDVAVLYASQTGTSERLAKKIAKELKAKGHTARIASLEGYAPAALATKECALILASTYGEGDPPDVAQPFFAQLCDDAAPRLEKLTYAVLALGDSHYEHFCKFGVDLDERLSSLGAKPLHPIVTCDVEVDEPFELWKSGLLARLAEAGAAGSMNGAAGSTNRASGHGVAPTNGAAKIAEPASQFHRDNPFAATLVEKRPLTHDTSSKQTLHLAFSLDGSDLVYEAGDALGVIAANDPALVAEILSQARLDAGASVTLPRWAHAMWWRR
jgi:sulfite reductase (NADPH) flavoprotein alpha-component